MITLVLLSFKNTHNRMFIYPTSAIGSVK